MTEKIIYKIEDVRVGDIVYYDGPEKCAQVIGVDLRDDDNSRLQIEPPEAFKPSTAYKRASVWLQDSYFHHATREIPDKKLPTVTTWHPQAFFTQSGRIVYFDGGSDRSYPWCHWGGVGLPLLHSAHDFLDSLPASEFPLRKAIPGEVTE